MAIWKEKRIFLFSCIVRYLVDYDKPKSKLEACKKASFFCINFNNWYDPLLHLSDLYFKEKWQIRSCEFYKGKQVLLFFVTEGQLVKN